MAFDWYNHLLKYRAINIVQQSKDIHGGLLIAQSHRVDSVVELCNEAMPEVKFSSQVNPDTGLKFIWWERKGVNYGQGSPSGIDGYHPC